MVEGENIFSRLKKSELWRVDWRRDGGTTGRGFGSVSWESRCRWGALCAGRAGGEGPPKGVIPGSCVAAELPPTVYPASSETPHLLSSGLWTLFLPLAPGEGGHGFAHQHHPLLRGSMMVRANGTTLCCRTPGWGERECRQVWFGASRAADEVREKLLGNCAVVEDAAPTLPCADHGQRRTSETLSFLV